LPEALRRITHGDRDWHERFFVFEGRAFRVATTFRRWTEHGGWHPGYEVFAIEEDGEILCTAGRERMHLVVDGAELRGYQLGAVATREDRRGRGLSRRLLTRILGEADAARLPVILFANKRVLDFYPRFGFTRIMQKRFTAPVEIEPAGHLAPLLDPHEPGDRARLAELCRRAHAPGTAFSARDYYPTLLWHLIDKPMPVYRLDEVGAAVVASVAGDRLVLHDVIATRPFDLSPVLPRLTAARVRLLEFGFGPERWWPAARPSPDDDIDTHLFVRGLPPLPTKAFRFPDLAQT
jgi:predicted N-acetyltransferase YhbS